MPQTSIKKEFSFLLRSKIIVWFIFCVTPSEFINFNDHYGIPAGFEIQRSDIFLGKVKIQSLTPKGVDRCATAAKGKPAGPERSEARSIGAVNGLKKEKKIFYI